MQKVKLSDALKVAQITSRCGGIEGIGTVDNVTHIIGDGVTYAVLEDALYWTGTAWKIDTVMYGADTVIPRVMGELVNYQKMVDLISKHKETEMEMENVFKLSEVIKVAEVSAGSFGKVTGVRPNGTHWIMEHANGGPSSIADDRIEWCLGMWMIDSNVKNVALGATITNNGKDISNPADMNKVLKSETNNLEEVLHGGIPAGQMAVINVKPGVYVPPQTATETDQEEGQRSPIWYENKVTWERSGGRKMSVPYCVRLSDLISAYPLRCYINGYPLADVIAYSDSKELVCAINSNGDEYVLVNTLTFSCENLVIYQVDHNNKKVNIAITEERQCTAGLTTGLSPALLRLQVSAVDVVLSSFKPGGECFFLSRRKDGFVAKVVMTEYVTHDSSRVLLVVRDENDGLVSALDIRINDFTRDDFVVIDTETKVKYFVKPFVATGTEAES